MKENYAAAGIADEVTEPVDDIVLLVKEEELHVPGGLLVEEDYLVLVLMHRMNPG